MSVVFAPTSIITRMDPICTGCGYDMSATKRTDKGYVCSECGATFDPFQQLAIPQWPGWRRVFSRAARPLLVVIAILAAWFWLLPTATGGGRNHVALLLVFPTIRGTPVLILVAAVWGPQVEARRLVPSPGIRHRLTASRGTIFTRTLGVNLVLIVLLWFVGSYWAGGQLQRSLPMMD